MAKDVSRLLIVNDSTEYLFKDLSARESISSLLGSGVLTSLTLGTFFAAPSNKDGLPSFRKIVASDLPTLNQNTTGIADYAKYLRGRATDGTYYDSKESNNIIAEWNTKSDDRWYLKAASDYECRVDYATTAGAVAKLQTSRTIWGQSFDGTADIPISSYAKMPYVLFKNYNDDGNAGYVGRGSSSSNTIYLSAYPGNALSLGANNGDDLYINTAHNVGIGTTSPGYRLHVNGDSAATSVTSTAGDFYVGGTSGSRCHIKMDTTNKCIKFIFD